MKGLRVSLSIIFSTAFFIIFAVHGILLGDYTDKAVPIHGEDCKETHGVFYGIFTTVHKRAQRDVFRKKIFCEGRGDFTVKFIIGRPSNRHELHLLAEERNMYGDIEILGCQENMNRGKTYHYFRHVHTNYPCYSFYAKVDDDTAFLPGKMASYMLSHQSLEPVYLGKKLPRAPWHYFDSIKEWIKNDFGGMAWYFNLSCYHTGMFYTLNHEAVSRLIGLNATDLLGDEDVRTGHWMNLLGSKVIDAGSFFHEHPETCAPERFSLCPNITKQSLAVHQCKSLERLVDGLTQMCVLNYVP